MLWHQEMQENVNKSASKPRSSWAFPCFWEYLAGGACCSYIGNLNNLFFVSSRRLAVMAAVAKVRKNGARPMNAKRETRIQTYFGKHRPKDRKGHQEAKTPRVNANAILIRRASGPRRGEITVLVVASRGFKPSPYPSLVLGQKVAVLWLCCGLAVA